MFWQSFIFVLVFIQLHSIAKVSGDIDVCISLNKTQNVSTEEFDDYSEIVKISKFKLTSLLEDNNNSTQYVDHLDFKLTHPAISIEGQLDDIYISNLNYYTLKYFQKINLLNNTMELFNLTFHNISLVGAYNLTGNIGGLFDIFGTGHFRLNMLNFSISGQSPLLPSINETHACISMNIHPHVEVMEGWFDDLMNDNELEELINQVIIEIAPTAIEVIWEERKDVLDPFLQKLIDSILNGNSSLLVSEVIKSHRKLGNGDHPSLPTM